MLNDKCQIEDVAYPTEAVICISPGPCERELNEADLAHTTRWLCRPMLLRPGLSTGGREARRSWRPPVGNSAPRQRELPPAGASC